MKKAQKSFSEVLLDESKETERTGAKAIICCFTFASVALVVFAWFASRHSDVNRQTMPQQVVTQEITSPTTTVKTVTFTVKPRLSTSPQK
ncbi:hypothetical protein KGQ27_01140 [Patescibacteria group bacterium]|nr:hypothetical protein [Patescibacteria group bacterium]MDE1946550.1 hypothetical protein [Patescibacteria group bacterium]MDE2010889.1 hypothetical protein [Patescibacteria group bacterium]MDE2232773.1 hypothetical protein [Patescibacteria group bacterium]